MKLLRKGDAIRCWCSVCHEVLFQRMTARNWKLLIKDDRIAKLLRAWGDGYGSSRQVVMKAQIVGGELVGAGWEE